MYFIYIWRPKKSEQRIKQKFNDNCDKSTIGNIIKFAHNKPTYILRNITRDYTLEWPSMPIPNKGLQSPSKFAWA
jgi:hypothetical protein